jgi:hypothetical protein
MGAISSFSFPVHVGVPFSRSTSLRTQPLMAVASSSQDVAATKLLTFLGKGGSGKTTAAIFAAQVFFYLFFIYSQFYFFFFTIYICNTKLVITTRKEGR